MRNKTQQLIRQIDNCGMCAAVMFACQGVAGLAIGQLRPEVAPVAMAVGIGSLVLGGLALALPAIGRAAPAWGGVVLSAMLVANLAMMGKAVGIPAVHPALQAGLGVVGYGGLAFLAVAAACAGGALRGCSAPVRPARRRRRRSSRPSLRRAA